MNRIESAFVLGLAATTVALMAPAAQAAADSSTVAVPRPRGTAAILIYPGVQIIDYTGPYEVFGQARFNVVTVAASTDMITTAMGMKVQPERTFADCPKVDVLIVPGGNADPVAGDPVTVEWVKKTSRDAKYTLSVCNGAFIIAAAGLLDGHTATTFYGLIDELRERAPKVRVVSDQRFVDNGNVITTAGLSSGIDGSLHVISKMFGQGKAEEIALHIEYDWRPDSGYARAALADRRLPSLRVDEVSEARTLSTRGTRDRWDKSWEMKSALTAGDLAERFAKLLAAERGWKRVGVKAGGQERHDLAVSEWTFEDDLGRPWTGRLSVQASETTSGASIVSVSIARAG
jgi:putative intracellular protease/amidase